MPKGKKGKCVKMDKESAARYVNGKVYNKPAEPAAKKGSE